MSDQNTERSDRFHAMAAGIFLVIATFFLFVGEVFYKPVLDAANVLERAAPERVVVITGILVEFTCVLAIPMVAVSLYPVLRRFGPAMALAYVVLRTLEATFFGIMEMSKLSFIGLSQLNIAAETADQAAFGAIAAFVSWQVAREGVAALVCLATFSVGTVAISWMMLRTRLVPPAIPVLGLISIVLLLVGALAFDFSAGPPAWAFFMLLPIAIQEMVFAGWLIVRGFSETALADGAKTAG